MLKSQLQPRRNHVLTVRVGPVERRSLRLAADSAGLSVSGYVRALVVPQAAADAASLMNDPEAGTAEKGRGEDGTSITIAH